MATNQSGWSLVGQLESALALARAGHLDSLYELLLDAMVVVSDRLGMSTADKSRAEIMNAAFKEARQSPINKVFIKDHQKPTAITFMGKEIDGFVSQANISFDQDRFYQGLDGGRETWPGRLSIEIDLRLTGMILQEHGFDDQG